jgi:hypothetical protein
MRNRMLELSPIFVARANLISPVGLAPGPFWWLRFTKPAARQPVVFLVLATAACIGTRCTLVLTAQGLHCLISRKWSKRGESGG